MSELQSRGHCDVLRFEKQSWKVIELPSRMTGHIEDKDGGIETMPVSVLIHMQP
jgi:hypothetical protein